MRAALAIVAVSLISLVAAMPAGSAVEGCSAPPVGPQTPRLTIKALHIIDKPVYARMCDLARGPIWDAGYATRPGMGLPMVIDAHDVTPVPGYGAHGPFYNLDRIRKGYLAKIKWHGVWRTYRFVGRPVPHPQSEPNAPIKSFGAEVVYFRCCWPRYTREDYLTARAVLVRQ